MLCPWQATRVSQRRRWCSGQHLLWHVAACTHAWRCVCSETCADLFTIRHEARTVLLDEGGWLMKACSHYYNVVGEESSERNEMRFDCVVQRCYWQVSCARSMYAVCVTDCQSTWVHCREIQHTEPPSAPGVLFDETLSCLPQFTTFDQNPKQ